MEKKLLNDILQWDVKTWSRPLMYWDKIISEEKRKLSCLELGSREGGLSLWLALKGHNVMSSDLENTAETAQPLHIKYGIGNNITYHNIDATSIPFENYFDVIIFKSILGGIGRNNNILAQKEVFNQIHKALKPGGKLLFAENLRATLFHNFFRKNFTRWGKEWRYVSLQEMKEFLSVFSKYEILTTGFAGVFGRNEKQKNVLSKVDGVVENVLSEGWKYVGFGSAWK